MCYYKVNISLYRNNGVFSTLRFCIDVDLLGNSLCSNVLAVFKGSENPIFLLSP